MELDKSAPHIALLFDNIAPKYDFLNHFLSLGIDKLWRKKLVREIAKRKPEKILDVATGTGDLAIALQRKTNAQITGIDISEGMLAIAKTKSKNVHWQTASAMSLPFSDNSFDTVAVSFGVRNFENLELGLQEMFRVLNCGGTLAILEFAMPTRFPIKQLYKFYFRRILPIIGRLFSKHKSAYNYLPASVDSFPQRNDFLAQLRNVGFENARYRSLSCGIAILYLAEKR